MHKFFSIINKVLTVFVVITLTGQSVVQAQPTQQDDKPHIDYSDSTGKVIFIGTDPNSPIVVRAANAPGLSYSESALAMVSQYETEFGLRNAASELQLLSEKQVGNRNVTRFQQVYQGIPVIAGEMVVNANDSAGLLSLSGEIAPDLDINTRPTITPQQATQTAIELMRKAYELTATEITLTAPELWIYDSRLLQPDGTAPTLVWRIEAQAQNNLPANEFILIDATRGHIVLNFNQVDTAWSDADTGKVENEEVPQTETPTPTPILPTSTPEPPQPPTLDDPIPQNDSQPTPTLPAEKNEIDQPDQTAPQPQAGIIYYVDIATGNNSNFCTTPASPCKDIQETINKASTGDIIFIASGVYTKSTNPSPNVVINNGKNLTLSGGWNSDFTAQSGVSTIDGQSTNNGYLHTGGTVILEAFIIQNSTSADSGAIYMVSGALTLKRTTLKNNSASNRGAGIFMSGAGTLTVENSTISSNTAFSGAGMYLANGTGATVTIKNSTISNNASTGGGSSGGGIAQANSAAITMTNTIVANNTASSNPDCNGTLSNASYNIIENASGCTITSGSNNSNVDPLLSANLSGTFQVHTPQVGSPAINGGTNTGCSSVDQLGNLRPQGISCDIGSVEVVGSGTKSVYGLTGSSQSAMINTNFSAPLVALVLDANNTPVSGVSVTFTAPASGASAIFSATSTNVTTVVTDANGQASTSILTANGTTGSYNVTASASGYTSVNFQLSNTPTVDPNGRYVSTTGSDASNSCSSPATPCQTINWAISQASSGNTVYVVEGTYTGTSGTHVVTMIKGVTLYGGWNSSFTTRTGYSTIDGQNLRSGIISSGGNSINNTIQYFIIQNGIDTGVEVYSPLTINYSLITRNRYKGIFASSSLTVNNTTIENNGIGANTVTQGAGIFIYVNNPLTINNSTIASNIGYGIYLSGVSASTAQITNIQNSTITNNLLNGIVIGNSNPSRIATITNSIISSNPAGDCSGTFNIANNTIIGNSTNCNISSGTNNQLNVNPLISEYPVGDMHYYTLKVMSPAINSGANCLTSDQRGISRPQGLACDSGAYEFTTAGPATSTGIAGGSNQRTALAKAFSSPLGVYVLDENGSGVAGVSVTFTAPSSGASGTFAGTNTNTATVTTSDTGLAISPVFTSNSQIGTYTVFAVVSGFSGTIDFQLSNFEWYVSTTGNDSNSCHSPAAACLTINGALNKASHGETVKVASGVYVNSSSQGVNLSKDLTLSGGWNSSFTTQSGQSTVDGNNKAYDGFTISGTNVSISRFIVKNSYRAINHTSGELNFEHGALINNNNGIYNLNGNIILTNATISGNAASGFAGSAVGNVSGLVDIRYSTITNNSGGSYAIYSLNGNAKIEIGNSILAGNINNGDCAASSTNITSNGYNLFGSSPACYSYGGSVFTPLTTDKTGVDPKLYFLIENGTHPLIAGSPAIESANLNLCPLVDQRGITRPQGSKCDIGAVEFATGGTVPVYIVNYQGSPQSIWISTPASVNFGVFVMDTEGKAVENATVTFTAPASGASGKFANNTTSTTAQTDSNGIALASTFTANAISGSYSVTATIQGLAANTSFALSNINVNVNTYTLNQTTSPLPGQFLCGINNLACTNGANPDADKAHIFAYGTYNFYKNHHGRQSINNAKMDIISSVDYGSGYQNAYWSGTQMVYGDGYSLADDVVAHELTHGVTQYESNLFYYYQSGAISESFSDVWGELFDQENGLGDDAPGVKWLIGEELPMVGPIRSMSNPPDYGDPDKMTSAYYNTASSDNGGVHTNSGINNKAAYLMVDGGTFNGKTVTALGANKTLAIYYEVQTNLLSSGSDYGDLYNLLYQACINLVNGADGITNADCQEVRDATDAVEMNLQPIANFNPDASLCGPSQTVIPVYQDGFESGLGSWTINNGATPRWQLDSPYGSFAHSGSHFLYGNDYPQSGVVTDATAKWSSKLIPAGAYLHFAHAYDFETGAYNYDGGVLEYSTNGGTTWIDAGKLINSNGYKGTIAPSYNNPLAGRSAFVGTSHGYISTRVNLTSLAGKNVSFRWRMGLDNYVYRWGWWIDDVQIYTCKDPLPTGWVGSVSISSDKNVVTVGRPHIGAEIASYDGYPSGATSAYVPMLFKDAFGGSYDAALYVQNVSGSSANITIKFYDSSGSLSCTKNDTVSSLASKGYWLPSESCLPAGWVGGALITSDQNIVAIGRPHIGSEVMTYNGFSSGSTSTSIPMLFKDAFGGSYDAAFYIQNIHPSNTANLTINFYDSSGALSCTKNDTLSPLASKGYWVPAESCLPTGWVGGVIVTSDQPIVSVGRPHIGSQITTYNGFSSGSSSSFIPMLFKDAFGGSYDSAFYIQNVHATNTANITIQFYDSAGTLSCTKNDTLAPFASKGFWVPSESCLPAGWVGGAVINSDQPIVGVGRPHIGAQITTYNGFSSGSSSSFLSMLFKDAFGGSYDSAFYVQNTEASQATVTTEFYDSAGTLTCSRTDTIQPKATLGIWLPSASCTP